MTTCSRRSVLPCASSHDSHCSLSRITHARLPNCHLADRKSEIVSLLESAGLNQSNPYYIVQQGQVDRLMAMRDSERLQLLKDIAGTSVYDQRRRESLKIMKETQAKLDDVQQIISYIDERIKELETQKAELQEYQKLTNTRRALEFTVYDQELKEAEMKLREIETLQQRSEEGDERLLAQEEQAAVRRRFLDSELAVANEELTQLQRLRDSLR